MTAALADGQRRRRSSSRCRSAGTPTPEEVAAVGRVPGRATPPRYITGAVIPVDGGLGMGH